MVKADPTALLDGPARSRLLWLIAWISIALIGVACWINWTQPRVIDFVSFWAAAQLAGPDAYDLAAHRAMEATAVPIRGQMPFPYPPPFLFVLAPFGLFGFGVALIGWTLVTAGLCLFAARRIDIFAHPGAIATGFIGQTGFLTTAIFVGGFGLLKRRPLIAGAVLGCMVIKPQLAILYPVALVCGREWRAMLGGAASAIILLMAALIAFGRETYRAFLSMMSHFAQLMADGSWAWNELASPYALARYFDASSAMAFAIHAAVALVAVGLVVRAWSGDHLHKVAILAAATTLISPYLFTYDCVVLALPLLVLASRPLIALTLWALSVLPVVAFFGLYDGPNTIPLAAVVSLLALAKPVASPFGRTRSITAPPTRSTRSRP